MAVPAATPVTTPPLDTVATLVLEDTQGVVASGVPEPERVEVEPAHALAVPLIVGNAFTVNVVVLLQPKEFL